MYRTNRISLIGLAVATAMPAFGAEIINRRILSAEGEPATGVGTAPADSSAPNPEKQATERKARKPRSDKGVKKSASKKPASKKIRTKAAKKPRAKKAGTEKMADVLSKAASQYKRPKDVKTPAGNQVVHCGDETAKKLEGKPLDAVYELAAKKLEGETLSGLKKKYGHLNLGQQRMALGNRLRPILNA